jgi:hypothetical protein
MRASTASSRNLNPASIKALVNNAGTAASTTQNAARRTFNMAMKMYRCAALTLATGWLLAGHAQAQSLSTQRAQAISLGMTPTHSM